MVARQDLITQAREYKALYPYATHKSLRTHLKQFVEDYDWVAKLPRESATDGSEVGCLLAIVLWPVIAIRNLFAKRRQARLIEEVIALVNAELQRDQSS